MAQWQAQSNNSLNRSANELAFYRQLVCTGGSPRPVNSGVRLHPLVEEVEGYYYSEVKSIW
jgi:hypothetical protein